MAALLIQRSGYRRKKGSHETPCKCDHARLAHYTKDGHCAFDGCGCMEFKAKGRPEYQVKRAACQFGHGHDSGLEIKVCFDLWCERQAGTIRDYSFHKVMDLLGPSGSVVATFETDFIVAHLDGTTEIVEAKGKHLETKPDFRLKWALLKDMYKRDRNYRFRMVLG